ncbi:MAG: hypothetical protein IKC30_05365 [Rikenellaceae bacterium]|nr:hypothetical protein [Rikenellaceae bacterium]
MEQIFRYTFGRRIRWVSIGVLILIVAAVFALYLLYDGGYISAWFLSITVAVVALCVLSIPRHIRLSDSSIEIHCILEMTEIELIDVASVEPIERRQIKWLVPVAASFGLFGYYGYYLNLRTLDWVRVYASQWANLVMITDKYEQQFLVSCDDPEQLISAIESARARALEALREARLEESENR